MNLLENGNRRKPSSRSRGRGYDTGSRAARNAAASRGRAASGSRSGSGSRSASGYSYRGSSHRRKKGPDYKMIAIIGVILIVLIACIVFVVKATKSGAGNETGESPTDGDCCDPSALLDALKHGNPFLWIRISILPWLPKIHEPCCATFTIGNIFRPAV